MNKRKTEARKPVTARYRYFGWWPTIREWKVAWFDLRNRLDGACNDCPRDQERGGGYSHWRCQLDRKHPGPHRYRNYTWAANGQNDYAPIDNPIRRDRDKREVPDFARSYRQRRREPRLLARPRKKVTIS